VRERERERERGAYSTGIRIRKKIVNSEKQVFILSRDQEYKRVSCMDVGEKERDGECETRAVVYKWSLVGNDNVQKIE